MAIMLPLAVFAVLAPCAHAEGDAAFAAALQAGRASLTFTSAAAFAGSAATREEQDLLDALNDNKPEVRVQALKGLKEYVANSSQSRDTVKAHLGYTSEDLSVRREAARSLTRAAADWGVRNDLLKHAKDSSNPAAVRAMAFKSLYWEAQYDDTVRDELVDYAHRGSDKETRLAAIWALMYAGGDSDVRRELLDLAQRSSDADVRREAAKSLYAQMNDSDVRRFARDAAEKGSGELRYVGIMMLATRSFDEDTRLLEEIAKKDSDAKARQYAVAALAGHTVEVSYFFHLNVYQWQGRIHRLVSEAIDRE